MQLQLIGLESDPQDHYYPPDDDLSVSETSTRCASQEAANSIVMEHYAQFKGDNVNELELSKNKAGYLKVSMVNGENDYGEPFVEETYEAGVWVPDFDWESASEPEDEGGGDDKDDDNDDEDQGKLGGADEDDKEDKYDAKAKDNKGEKDCGAGRVAKVKEEARDEEVPER